MDKDNENKDQPYTITVDDNYGLSMMPNKTYYKVNIDKVKTIKDIKLILKYLDLSFSPPSKEAYEEIKHLLIVN